MKNIIIILSKTLILLTVANPCFAASIKPLKLVPLVDYQPTSNIEQSTSDNQNELIEEYSELILKNLEKTSIIKLLFENYPQERITFKDKIGQLFLSLAAKEIDEQEFFNEYQKMARDLITKYYKVHTPTASDKSIIASVVEELETYKLLQKNPKECVAFKMSNNINPSILDEETLLKRSKTKSDMIESSIKNPNPLHRKPLTNLEITELVKEGYRIKGFDISYFDNLYKLNEISPENGCEAAIKYAEAILALPNDKIVLLIKSQYMNISENDNSIN